MNTEQEKQLQENLFDIRRSGKEVANSAGEEESRVYNLIFDALEETPELDIPEDFAIKTAHKAIRKKWLHELVNQLMWYCGVAAAIVTLSSVFFYLYGDKILNSLQSLAIQYRWYLLIGVIIFLVIQLADNFVLKDKKQKMLLK